MTLTTLQQASGLDHLRSARQEPSPSLGLLGVTSSWNELRLLAWEQVLSPPHCLLFSFS